MASYSDAKFHNGSLPQEWYENTMLDLSEISLGGDAGEAIAQLLDANRKLTDLNLRDNSLGKTEGEGSI